MPDKYKRNWKQYNEQLILRGEIYLDFEFVSNWNKELKEMNRNKIGALLKILKIGCERVKIWIFERKNWRLICWKREK